MSEREPLETTWELYKRGDQRMSKKRRVLRRRIAKWWRYGETAPNIAWVLGVSTAHVQREIASMRKNGADLPRRQPAQHREPTQ